MNEPCKPAGSAQTESLSITAGASASGLRLDQYLAGQMPEHISRARVKTLIEQGQVLVNGQTCRLPRHKLAEGDLINLSVPVPEDPEPKPESIPLTILHEDTDLIVIDKPAGIVVHPAPGNWSGTLVNALLHHCGDSLQGIGGVRRPGIVHRLDKETSGVMVAAKTQAAHSGLAAQFADHGRSGPLKRAYLALVWGKPDKTEATIDTYLGRDRGSRVKRAVVSAGASDAREAITQYRLVETLSGSEDGQIHASLVECRLETGRTHQIRVHMAHFGHPLVGDNLYGGHFRTKANRLAPEVGQAIPAFARQALHAAALGFRHPVSGEAMQFEAPLPADFVHLLQIFAKHPPKR